jgi:hypothetical protein
VLLTEHVGQQFQDEGRPIGEMVFRGRNMFSIFELPGRFLVRIPNLADFEIDIASSEIACRPEPDTDLEALGLLLCGTALSTFMTLKGRCVLHASAVEVEGQAVAFAGLTGMGKSTCAALACARGARLVTDDVLVVDTGKATPVCRSGTSHLRLRGAATSIIDSMGPDLETWTTIDNRTAVVPLRSKEHLPLSAVVIPKPSRGARELTMEQHSPSRSVADLLMCLRVPGWSEQNIIGNQFRQVAALVSKVPVYWADIPWGPPFSLKPIEDLLVSVTG